MYIKGRRRLEGLSKICGDIFIFTAASNSRSRYLICSHHRTKPASMKTAFDSGRRVLYHRPPKDKCVCVDGWNIKAHSTRACLAHAVPLPCRVSFPFDLHSAAVSDSHLPCRAHAMLLPCHSSQGHGIERPPRDGLWATCWCLASSGYHAEFHEVVIRRIPISDAGGRCETKHCLHGLGKEW